MPSIPAFGVGPSKPPESCSLAAIHRLCRCGYSAGPVPCFYGPSSWEKTMQRKRRHPGTCHELATIQAFPRRFSLPCVIRVARIRWGESGANGHAQRSRSPNHLRRGGRGVLRYGGRVSDVGNTMATAQLLVSGRLFARTQHNSNGCTPCGFIPAVPFTSSQMKRPLFRRALHGHDGRDCHDGHRGVSQRPTIENGCNRYGG